jgi:hypothetical protein
MTINAPHERRVGDTVKVYSAVLMYRDSSGANTPRDLTGLSVTFTMTNAATGVAKVSNAAATIVTAASGIVSYDFQAADVDTAGIYWVTFKVTESAETDTYPVLPSEGVIWIHGITQTAQEAYKAAVAEYEAAQDWILADFPEVLHIGDSYTSTNGKQISVPIVDQDNEPISGIGSRNFVDADVTFAIRRVNETGNSRVITGTATFVDPPGSSAADAPYVLISLPSSETENGLVGYKYREVLTFTWDGPGTDVHSYTTETLKFEY